MYRYRHDGKPQKISLGRYPDLTLKTARDKRDELAAQVVGGRSPAEEKKARRQGRDDEPTMREFGDRYYHEQAMRTRKNPPEFLRYLTTYVYPAIGQKRLKELTALDIQAIVYKKRDEGHETAALMLRQNLKLVFDYAINLQLIPMNPATMVAPRYIGRHRKRSRVFRSILQRSGGSRRTDSAKMYRRNSPPSPVFVKSVNKPAASSRSRITGEVEPVSLKALRASSIALSGIAKSKMWSEIADTRSATRGRPLPSIATQWQWNTTRVFSTLLCTCTSFSSAES